MKRLQPLSGDFIVTVTRNGKNNVGLARHKVQAKRKTLNINQPIIIYSFTDFDDVLTFCNFATKALTDKKINTDKNSSFYQYLNKYYICLKNISGNTQAVKRFFSLASEFGTCVDSSTLFERKLIEYGTKIISKNAISTLNKKF